MNIVAVNLRGREGGAMPELDILASVRASSGGSSRSYVAHTLRSEGFDASEDGTGRGTPIVAFSGHGEGEGEADTANAITRPSRGSKWKGNSSDTFAVGDPKGGRGSAVRRLTPT